jgi:ComF family protein
MINRLLQIVAPHHCYGCGKTGLLLCSNCKYDIADEPFEACLVCALPSQAGICAHCQTSYEAAWCVGERVDTLEALINGLKFARVKDAAAVLGELLDARLPELPATTVVVPIPTVSTHIRQRGYDQTLLIARQLSRRRNMILKQELSRRDRHTQRGQNKRARFEQAKTAFECRGSLDPAVPYLLVDDVVTTNATVRYAAQALKDAGAQIVWVAVTARQPLDK